MIKKSLKIFGLFCAGALLGALFFEGYLRLVEITPAKNILPVAEVSLYGPDAETGYTHRANLSGMWATEHRSAVSTNLYGLRSNGLADETLGQNDGWYRVGIIGNSVVESLQVGDNETFVARAEQTLQKAGHKVRIYNLGLAGSSPVVEARRAAKFAKRLDLDLVIFIDSPDNITTRLDHSQGKTLPFYALNNDGDVIVDETYLKSRAYQLRQSYLGQAFYGLMQHLKIMNVLNNRLNHGIFAELEGFNKSENKNPERKITALCETNALKMLSDRKDKTSAHQKLLNAFLDDLKTIEKSTKAEIVFGLYDTWEDCDQALHQSAYSNFSQNLKSKNLEFFDLKTALRQNLPQSQDIDLTSLRGFGSERGYGHLNYLGHDVFTATLENHLKKRQ